MSAKKIEIIQDVPFSMEEMVSLVKDVPNYDKFLPWVKAVRLWNIAPDNSSFDAQLMIGYKAFRAPFSTNVIIDEANNAIKTSLIDNPKKSFGFFLRPMKSLDCSWKFEPNGGHCKINLKIVFEFSEPILAGLLANNLDRATKKLMQAFMEEAKKRFS